MFDRRKLKGGGIPLVLAAVTIALSWVALGSGQVGGPPGSPVDPTQNELTDAAATPEEEAAAHAGMAKWIQDKYGVADASQHVKARELVKDKAAGEFHGKVDQYSRGIKVRGGELSATINNGVVDDSRSHGVFIDDADTVDIKPKLQKKTAIGIAKKKLKEELAKLGGPPKDDRAPRERPDRSLAAVAAVSDSDAAELEIHPGEGRGKRKLTYHVSVKEDSANGPVHLEAWVDQDGEIVEAYNNAQTGVYNGFGNTFYQGWQGLGYGINYFKVDYWPAAYAWVLNDNSLRIGTYDSYGGSGVYQASVSGCCGPYFGNGTLGDRNSTNADAHLSTVQTYSFMYWVLGRNFVDGAGGPRKYYSIDGLGPLISARNHYGYKYNNAFWDGSQITLGDGDGVSFRSFATLDIIGHEWTHGLTQYTAGLNYYGESGALNEAFSDILGSMAERYWYGESANTWKIGEGSYTPGTAGDALRYMNTPWVGGQPWSYPGRYTGTGDNGGVHINSGIANYAFYILAKGGCGYNCVGAIGPDAATQIFYRALRYYMIPSDNFYWARYCTLWAAGDLYGYGSYQYNQVWNAWNAVGAPQ
jgi:Zn-dependent metalloprotease